MAVGGPRGSELHPGGGATGAGSTKCAPSYTGQFSWVVGFVSIARRFRSGNFTELATLRRVREAAIPPGWEDAERAERLAARIPQETGLPEELARELVQLCRASADPDGSLAGAIRALAAHKDRAGAPRAPLEPLGRIRAA